MADEYRLTGLWQRSIGAAGDPVTSTHLERLRSNYDGFRAKTAVLTEKIATALPNLTIHDVTHLDALWETADLIAGPNYPINPLEGFIFGGAVLLHDAALCFEAYDGGQVGLRSTLAWKDAFASETERNKANSEEELNDLADFSALRTLHSRQAETLAMRGWDTPNGDKLFLLDDPELRSQFGKLIGLIASSHHWSIEDVQARLPNQLNAIGTLPRDWRVDPVKIACLLRCADAAHIDNRRAPDFLYALMRRQGLSGNHWKAQNWLSRVDLDKSDPTGSSILFTSNKEFGPEDVDAWWVAHDAVLILDRELKSANELLGCCPQEYASPTFAAKQVSGISNPAKLSEFIRVVGWRPCSAEIHVSNVEQLVRSLGGENLYGEHDQFNVGLRELIQNARDAVAARRSIDADYSGSIRVRLISRQSGGFDLEVSDDGIGMSERILTGPLLDFGNSFWSSTLVQTEFPGLKSSKFRSVGKFGIGFYSIFMIATKVEVSTRRWDAGLSEVRTLSFPAGITLRPTLSYGRPDGFTSYMSTRVVCRLTDEFCSLSTIKVRSGLMGQSDFEVPFEKYLAALVVGLDVRVEIQESSDEKPRVIHIPVSQMETEDARKAWLRDVSFVEYSGSATTASVIDSHANRLRYLKSEGEVLGLAALASTIDNSANFLSIETIGGLAVSVHGRVDQTIVGYIDSHPKSAKRDAKEFRVSREVIQDWADTQIELLKACQTDPVSWCAVTSNLCDLQLDPLQVAHVLVSTPNGVSVMSIKQVLDTVKSQGLAIFKSQHLEHVETYHQVALYENYPTYRPVRNSGFLGLEVVGGEPKNRFSFIGCLIRCASSEGTSINFELRRNVALAAFGRMDVLLLS